MNISNYSITWNFFCDSLISFWFELELICELDVTVSQFYLMQTDPIC